MINSIIRATSNDLIGLNVILCLKFKNSSLEVMRVLFLENKLKLNLN
jgi:hypothetical protein